MESTSLEGLVASVDDAVSPLQGCRSSVGLVWIDPDVGSNRMYEVSFKLPSSNCTRESRNTWILCIYKIDSIFLMNRFLLVDWNSF